MSTFYLCEIIIYPRTFTEQISK